MLVQLRKIALYALAAGVLPMAQACSSQGPDLSKPLVTDVEHSIVKRQSIGNCWIYAQATWLESELLTASGQEVDVSESYWTWWHFYDQIVGSNETELQTGGFWWESANIIMKHGFVLEGEFISSEAGVEMSAAQLNAETYINSQLKAGGKLATAAQRTPDRVRKELDKAFGSNMAVSEPLARSAADTKLKADGTTLAQALAGDQSTKWQTVNFPRIFGQGATPNANTIAARKALLTRVEKALNDKQPVVMSLMIDFNALDTEDATFKAALLAQSGIGHQGGHMVVLEDYTVDNVPGIGTIGEGEVSPELKAAALTGDMLTLKAKNSWGKDRPDRGLTDGYTSFDRDYLLNTLEWKNGEEGTTTSFYTTLTDFTLPPGY